MIYANAKHIFRKVGNGKACVLEEYSTESRGSANLSEVSTESSASFSKEVPENNNSDSIAGQ